MLERYWAWNYEIKDLGFWPGEGYKGHNMPVEVVKATDAQATIADLQGQVGAMDAERRRDAIDGQSAMEMLQQRVTQLEQELTKCENAYHDVGRLNDKLKADHARVLGLVQALDVPRQYVVSVDDYGGQIMMPDGYKLYSATSRARTYALENLIDYARDKAASLPAQPAVRRVRG